MASRPCGGGPRQPGQGAHVYLWRVVGELRENIRREIQIMQHFSGQAKIVEFRGALEDNSNVHVVMELCSGGELFDRIIAKGHYTEWRRMQCLRPLISGFQSPMKKAIFFVTAKCKQSVP
ncbi:hypothetical protein PVAP13_8KG324016 [Panicum virgatum]|uniref:Protein kinase domain-containing protein n=1 Tax=Panicum virgatum TaxID=38727 RepID=A0A8T0PRP3_PANVG|nr:hypothetical protein PVAP13_8KG324016 [Panicum virgatum]